VVSTSITLYKVENKNIIRSGDQELDPDSIYIIVDRTPVRAKIWVWSGPNSSIKDRYFAGVSATTIKSQEKLYGSSIEVVEGGSEPEQFPKLEETRILTPSDEEIQHTISMEVVSPELNYSKTTTVENEEVDGVTTVEEEFAKKLEEQIEVEATEQEMSNFEEAEASVSAGKSEWGPDRLWKQKVKSLMADLSHDLEEIRNKIEGFISEL
jgi:hypothetical protein